MSTTSVGRVEADHWATDWDIWRCVKCQGSLRPETGEPALRCGGCGTLVAIEDDVLVVKEMATENNGVAQDFYDSPLWPKFRFWEKFTWWCNGGERRARNQVLKHLPSGPKIDLLDIAIGDGVYLPWLPKQWRIVGADISRSQLAACRRRAEGRPVWLTQCEAETLPIADQQFDAVLSIGAFNYFNDPEAALREMVRVARPGATIVISDEVPDLMDRMKVGRMIGKPEIDRWIVSRLMNLGDAFTDLAHRYRDLDVQAVARRVLPDFQYQTVWHGVGYVLVGQVPRE